MYDVIKNIRYGQSMRIHLKNNPPNFIPIRFETTEPLAFLKRSPQQQEEQQEQQ